MRFLKTYEMNRPWENENQVILDIEKKIISLWGEKLKISYFDYKYFEGSKTYLVSFVTYNAINEKTSDAYEEFIRVIKKTKGWEIQTSLNKFVVRLPISIEDNDFLNELDLIYKTRKYNL